MLKAKVLPQILQQVVTPGIKGVIVLNAEGSLLATAGEKKNDKIIGAIVANVMSLYQDAGEAILSNDGVNMILVDCEHGRLAISRVSRLLLCIFSDTTVHFGALKAKSDALRAHLEPQLNKVLF
eukprot:TRINITY_DN1902_c0_g1_i1.p1 TRINITY_DN1902_c0_g1~~TRINITY_DN1902_c0_g1_i1.p1  ORF type:complete len:140 (-),score=42.25 TRINITY_DN1902_c0_g1_i1:51-422(-)